MKWIILFMIFAGAVPAQQKPFAELKKENNEIPKGYYHDNYYPNPFCPATIAKFGIPDTCTVRLFLTDSLNARVTDTLFTGSLPPGNYEYNYFKVLEKYKSKP